MKDKLDVTRVGTPKNTINTKNTYTYDIVFNRSDVFETVQALHMLGHGVSRGVSPTEHLWRVFDRINGHQHLIRIVKDTGEVVGAVSFYPEAVEDNHYMDKVLFTDFIVVAPNNPGAAQVVRRAIINVARTFGAGRVAISKKHSENSYILTYHKVGTK